MGHILTFVSFVLVLNVGFVASVAPVFTNLPGTGTSLIESSTVASTVFTVTAVDGDGDAITYNIVGPAGAPFSIDSAGAVIYDGTGLDFDTTPSYSLQVTVTANGDTTGPATVTVRITNINESPFWTFSPGTKNPVQSISIDENAAHGTAVYISAAQDPEGSAVAYHFEFTVPGLGFDVTPAYMQFDMNTGLLSIANPPGLNYETVTTGPIPQLELFIEATDGTFTTYPAFDMVLKITVNDIAEAPIFNNLQANVSLSEVYPGGTTLYDVDASDQDTGTTLTYSISGGAMFSINGTDGVISVAVSPGFDFEVTPQYILAVEVTDSILTSTSTLTVDITDVNEAPVIANLPNLVGTVLLLEDTATFTNVFLISATDPESSNLSYSIVVPAVIPFVVWPSGMVSCVTNPGFDFEATPQYLLTIAVSDGALTSTATLTVDITNVNDPPNIRNLPASLAIPKTSSGSIFSCDLYDADGDALVVALTTDPASTPGNPFTIDSAGIISVSDPPGVDPATQTLWTLTIHVTDPSASTDTKILLLTILNDINKPSIWNLPRTVTVAEDVTTQAIIYTVQTINLVGGTLLYTMAASPVDGNFQIEAATGEISFINSPTFNFEAIPTYTLTVIVSNGIETSDSKVITVTVTNVNEAPSVSNLPATSTVPENSVNTALIFTVTASDPDDDTLVSTMTVDPASGSAKFSLDPLKHEVSVVTNPGLDAETENQYRLYITVTDGSLMSAVYVLNVDITDVNEAPGFAASLVSVDIEEEQAVGWALPVSCLATDPDASDTLTYEIVVAANSDFFNLDTGSGCAVKLVKQFDSEDLASPDAVSIDIKVRDSGGLTTIMQLDVAIINLNEHAPVFSNPTYSVNINENLPAGTTVLGTNATDLDAGLPGTVTYTISGVNGNTYFTVNTGGEVVVKTPVDFETTASVVFDVIASDAGSPPRAATSVVVVTVNNLNDNRPVFAALYYSFEVDVASAVYSSVGRIKATDADDSGSTLTYIIVGGSTYFSMGTNSGSINLALGVLPGQKEVMYVVAEDNGVPKQTSTATPIRIDAYACSDVTIVFTVTKNSAYFDAAGRASFISSMKGLYIGKIPRIVKVEAVNSLTTKLHAYILLDDYASSLSLFGQSKKYLTQANALSAATLGDQVGTPVPYFETSGVFINYPVTAVTCECCTSTTTIEAEVTTTNWWLDTQEGNATLGVFSVLAVGILVAGIILATVVCYKCCRKTGLKSYKRKTPPTKKPSQVKHESDVYNRNTYSPSPTNDTLRWLHPAPLIKFPTPSAKTPRIAFKESRASPDGFSNKGHNSDV